MQGQDCATCFCGAPCPPPPHLVEVSSGRAPVDLQLTQQCPPDRPAHIDQVVALGDICSYDEHGLNLRLGCHPHLVLTYSEVAFVAWGGGGGPSASYIVCAVFPSLCVPSVSAGNLATSPVPGTVSHLVLNTCCGWLSLFKAVRQRWPCSLPLSPPWKQRCAMRIQSISCPP
jgi:hypothetical protein